MVAFVYLGVYVRAQYISGDKVQKTKKTGKVPGSCDPVYNEALSFSLPNKQLEAVRFSVTVLTSKSGMRIHKQKDAKSKILVRISHWGDGRRPLTRALFGENVCENERIGSRGGGCAGGAPGSANAKGRVVMIQQYCSGLTGYRCPD